MKRGISNLIFSLPVAISLMSFFCVMPDDPTDPSKTEITAVFKNADSVVFEKTVVDTVGNPLSIGAALYLPVNFDSISLLIEEDDVITVDTMFKTFRDEYFFDTAWYTLTFSSDGIKKVTLTPYSALSLQPLSVSIPIVARPVDAQVSISFISNATSATGTMPVQTYASGNSIELPENVFVNPGYQFSGWATTETGSVTYRDKEEITTDTTDLVLYAVWVDQDIIGPSIIYAPSQLIAGKADTLLFAVDNSSRTDTLTISLITDPPLDPTVFSIVPTGSDSIMIAVSQSADPTTATIGIITSNGTKNDTAKYTITLISSDEALWNTTSLDLDAVEGSQYNLDLSQYLSDANREGVSLSADSGTIDNTNWSYTPQWGCAEKLAATITAKKGDLSHTLTLNLTVAAGDTTKPQLSLVDASLDGKKVSSSQITVECKATDAEAGVESVVFTYGEQQVSGTLQGEDIYSGVITGLVHNTPTQITITGTDKSRNKNSAFITCTVTRDSTILDAEPPVIVKTAGPESGARVKNSEGSLTFTVSDNSGVDSVWWTLNDAFVATVSSSGENQYMITYTLSSFGSNGIKLYAKDESSAGNEGSQTITLNYNTEPTAIAPSGPEDGASGVSLTPSFTWTGGADPDGDSVFYRVFYGTSATDLSQMTSVLTSNTVTLASAEQLTPKTNYYWQIIGWSKAFTDTVRSEVISFTTLDPTAEDQTGPQIAQTAGPVDSARVTSATGTITVSVTDPNNVTSVTAMLNSGTAQTLTADANNTYAYSFTLNTSGENKVIFTAIDGSANSNSSTKTILFNYNTEPSAITLTTPDANATGVSTSPTFKWSGGDDEDGDEITFTVNYGTTQTSLSSTATVNGKTATPSSALEYAKTYYWQVTATSSSTDYPDEVQSSVGTFTTEGSLPEISAHPQPESVEEGQNVTFYVTASGFGTLSYQWRQNGVNITSSANGPSYTLSSVTTSMNSNTYDCVVSNEVGNTISNAAILTVSSIPTFTVSFDMHDGDAIASQTIVRDGYAQEPSTPQRDGFAFKGWFTSSAYATEFSFGTPITVNQTIHALWVEVYTVTYYPNTADDGSVPTDTKKYESGDLVTVAENTGGLNKSGYTFSGWTTNSVGTGTVYNNPTTIQVGSAAITLYAKWELNAPTINSGITNKTCPVNDAVTFTVVATGADLSYTWQKNGETIDNATGSSYTDGPTVDDTSNGSTYKCIVSNSAGSKECSATLSVSTVTDRDGNVYHEVKIGEQVWMMENLRVTQYNDGTAIPNDTGATTWAARTSPGYCWYNNARESAINYNLGALYNWYTVSNTNSHELAPEGWHVPAFTEWAELVNYCIANGYNYDGTTDSNKIAKSLASTTGWYTSTYTGAVGNDLSTNNRTGFSAIPAGHRELTNKGAKFDEYGTITNFWSTTDSDTLATFIYLENKYSYIGYSTWGKKYGFSVRCIKD